MLAVEEELTAQFEQRPYFRGGLLDRDSRLVGEVPAFADLGPAKAPCISRQPWTGRDQGSAWSRRYSSMIPKLMVALISVTPATATRGGLTLVIGRRRCEHAGRVEDLDCDQRRVIAVGLA